MKLGRGLFALSTIFALILPSIFLVLPVAVNAQTTDVALQRGYRTGVSLIALLQREPGKIKVRQRPDSIAPDRYNPQQRTLELV